MTNKTVFVFTSLSFLKKKPNNKNAGRENNNARLEIVEKPFEN